MRHIEIEPGLRLRFPERDASFDEGVEIGVLIGHMAAGRPEFSLRLAAATLEQARAASVAMGYRVHAVERDDGTVEIAVMVRGRRPRLALVHNAVKLAAG